MFSCCALVKKCNQNSSDMDQLSIEVVTQLHNPPHTQRLKPQSKKMWYIVSFASSQTQHLLCSSIPLSLRTSLTGRIPRNSLHVKNLILSTLSSTVEISPLTVPTFPNNLLATKYADLTVNCPNIESSCPVQFLKT